MTERLTDNWTSVERGPGESEAAMASRRSSAAQCQNKCCNKRAQRGHDEIESKLESEREGAGERRRFFMLRDADARLPAAVIFLRCCCCCCTYLFPANKAPLTPRSPILPLSAHGTLCRSPVLSLSLVLAPASTLCAARHMLPAVTQPAQLCCCCCCCSARVCACVCVRAANGIQH